MNPERIIQIDYYMGASGPIIRIHIPSLEVLSVVKNIVQKLASGKVSEFNFCGEPLVELIGLLNLCMRVIPVQSYKTVNVINREEGMAVAIWSNTIEGWDECAGMLDGFNDAIPAHQYLSEEGIDDALIVVSYLE